MLKRLVLISALFFLLLSNSANAVQNLPLSDEAKQILDGLGIGENASIVLLDINENEILYEQNADKKVNTASTAKLLTCIAALETCELSEVVTVSRAASLRKGSSLGLMEGEQLTLSDLISGMMVTSGNDAAQAVAEHVSGSQKEFALLMNEIAERIGMSSSHFTNSVGDSDRKNYSTAADMALLAKYALSNEQLVAMTSRVSFVLPQTNLQPERKVYSTNRLLHPESEYYYPYAFGLKTGSSIRGKGNLVATAEKNGVRLVCVVMNDQSEEYTDRWNIAAALFDYGFSKYTVLNLEELLCEKTGIELEAENANTKLVCETQELKPGTITVRNALAEQICSGEIATSIDTVDIELPVKAGDYLGTVSYYSESTGIKLGTAKITAMNNVYQKRLMFDDRMVIAPVFEPSNDHVVPKTSVLASLNWIGIAMFSLIACLLIMIISVFTVGKTRR